MEKFTSTQTFTFDERFSPDDVIISVPAGSSVTLSIFDGDTFVVFDTLTGSSADKVYCRNSTIKAELTGDSFSVSSYSSKA